MSDQSQPTTTATSHAEPPSASLWCWLLRIPVQVGLILVIGLAIYQHTLKAPFILDDVYCITDNPAIRSFDILLDFDKIQTLNIWTDIKNNIALRPVTYWTFALNYQLGGLDVFGYHLFNIVIHLVNALLIYALSRITLSCCRINWSSPHLAGTIPFLVALLFAAHPLQTQAVTYINQRFTSLATTFYLAALLLYVVARSTEQVRVRWGSYGLALLLTVAAMKTKSIAFTLPFMILLYEYFFLNGGWRQRFIWLAPFAMMLLIIPGTLYWLVSTDGVDDPRGSLAQSVNMANFTGISQWDYLRTQFGVIVTYLRLFFLPAGQNIIPYYPVTPGLFTPGGGIIPLILLAALFCTALRLAVRALRAGQRSSGLLVAFGILWFFVSISMSSSLIPLDTMMLEYRVYLPSFGFFLAVTVAIAVAVDNGRIPFRLFIGAAVLVVTLLGTATYARNDIYNDELRLLNDTLEKNPQALSARVGLAVTLLSRGRFDEAIFQLARVLEEIPNDPNMRVNMGLALEQVGRIDEAIEQHRKSIELAPGLSLPHGNLGIAYLKKGRLAEAESELKIALKINPHFGPARYYLGRLYAETGRREDAIGQFRQLLKSFPGDTGAIEQLRLLGAAGH